MRKKIYSILALLCITASSAWGQHKPTGNFDGCQGFNGSFLSNGWAWDEDSPNTAITVHIYVFKSNEEGKMTPLPSNENVQTYFAIKADKFKQSLLDAGKGNGYHSFDGTYHELPAGTWYVGVWGIDATDGNNQIGGFKSITVSAPFAVTYNANGGSGAPDAQQKCTGIDLALSSTVPTRTGYTFDGWATSADGAVAYAPGATYTGDAALSLYAHWTQNTASLTDGDDLSALSTYAGKTCTVTYSRSFTADKPSTVCLPFAYATASAGGTFYTFTGISKPASEYIADMTAYSDANLVANTPYLFVPSATGSVNFGGTYAIPAELTAGSTTNGDWTFVGTYTEKKWDTAPTGIYGFSAQNVDAQGINQGEFVKVGAYVRVKPMRCYLKYKNGGEDYAGARAMTRAAAADEPLPETIKVRLIGANGEVTAIGTLHTQTGEVVLDGWYTLDGTRLSGQPTRKGIYVNNGKKVIIK